MRENITNLGLLICELGFFEDQRVSFQNVCLFVNLIFKMKLAYEMKWKNNWKLVDIIVRDLHKNFHLISCSFDASRKMFK